MLIVSTKYLSRYATGIALCCIGSIALAQTTPTSGTANTDTSQADGTTQLQEVIVTAQKRSELLSKAPLAITAVSQGEMDELGITTAQDLVQTVPNFQLSANGYTPQLSIRGIGNFSGSYSTVAVQVDGIYEPNTAALTNGLYDVSQVEVARGPQGTVYGRNATAGVLNINTTDPTKQLLAFGDVSYGNYDDVTSRSVVNVPLGDNVQIRASFVRETNDGYYDGGAAPRNYAQTDILTARLVTKIEFTDSLTWRIALERADNTGTINRTQMVNYLYYPQANLTTGYLGSPVIVGPIHSDILGQDTEPDNSVDTWESSLRSRLTWAINDAFTATYLMGFSAFVDNGIDSANGAFSAAARGTDTRALTHEFDLNYDSNSFKAVAGLYYYRDYSSGLGALNIGNTVPYPFSTLVPGPINNPVGNEPSVYGLIDILADTLESNDVSKAAFTQGTYSITQALRLTGGVRFTKDTHAIDSTTQVCLWGSIPVDGSTCAVPFGPPSTTIQSVESHNTSWKASLDYDLTADQLLYATVATGYRGGGVSGNTLLPAQYLTYAPETVTNYEVGWKSTLLNKALALSFDIFDMDYKNMQVGAIEHDLTGTPTPVTINAGKSEIKGAEFEADWRVTTADKIQGFATYLDAKFTSFPDGVNSTTNPDGIYNSTVGALDAAGAAYGLVPTNVPTNFGGKFLPYAPQATFRIAYSHTFSLGSLGTLAPALDTYWQSNSYSDLSNSIQGALRPYSRSDFNLVYKSESGRYTVDAYVRNIENSAVFQSANGKWDETTAYYSPPRTFGVRVGIRLE